MDINTTSESPLILIACSLRKRPVASEARSLYVGELFKKAKRIAEQLGLDWLILSAKYGIVKPTDWLLPYDTSLSCTPRAARLRWGLRQATYLSPFTRPLIALCGTSYLSPILAAAHRFERFPDVFRPLLGQGIGQQLQTLSRLAHASSLSPLLRHHVPFTPPRQRSLFRESFGP